MRRKHVRDYVVDKTVEGGYRYVGEYYLDSTEPKTRKRIGLFDVLFGILELMFAVLALSLNCIGNRTIYVVIPLEIMMICYFVYILGAYSYLKTNGKMEKRQYEDSVQRMVHMRTIALCMSLCSIVGQVYIVFQGRFFSEKYFEYVLLMILLVLGILNFVLWKHKRKFILGIIKEEHS